VATPMGAAPEIIKDGVTGFICSTEHGLASAVLASAGLDRTACRAAVAGHFSAQRMVAEHVALYERIVEGSMLPLVA
jgi:glycosyltransferase involved in cell wall biosynthesis